MTDKQKDENEVLVEIGDQKYSQRQCEIMHKQLLEGTPIIDEGDADAVVLALLGGLWHDSIPYHKSNNGCHEVRKIINTLSLKILNLQARLTQRQLETETLQSRLSGEWNV